jgi:hypothetical protein
MSNIDLLSSKILSNKDILIELYSIIKQAAINTSLDENVISQKNNICVLPLNKHDVIRVTQKCIDSRGGEVIYNPDALTIIGGAALNLYEFELDEFKIRHGIPELKDFTKKSTSDLDMVWWPEFNIIDPELNNMCAVSQSIAIETVAKTFTTKINNIFQEDTASNVLKNISSILGDTTYMSAVVRPIFPAGVWNIQCAFISNGVSYKIIDIAIHDTASGQRQNEYGYNIKSLLPMSSDPVYATLKGNTDATIKELIFNDKKVAVCNIQQFIRQQNFAFLLLVKEPTSQRAAKGFINYKRIIYIIELLNSVNRNNSLNISVLQNIFNISTYDNRTRLLNKIIQELRSAINLNYTSIINLYENLNINDPIINELYIIALENRIKDIIQKYNKNKLNIEYPLREIKRTKRKLSADKRDEIIKQVKEGIEQLENEYTIEINKLKDKINVVQKDSTQLLKIKNSKIYNDVNTLPNYIKPTPSAPPISPAPSNSISNNYFSANKSINKTSNTKQDSIKDIPKTKLLSIRPPNIRPPNIYSPPIVLKSDMSKSRRMYTVPPPPQPQSVYYPSTYSQTTYAPPLPKSIPPPLPQYPQYPQQKYSEPLIYIGRQVFTKNQLINGSRLIFDPDTNKYKLFDVLHNMPIDVYYNKETEQYDMFDSINNIWIPILYDFTNGKYYPVYYYKDKQSYAIYDDITNRRFNVIYDNKLGRYLIDKSTVIASTNQTRTNKYARGYRGGYKTRKNKN